MPMQRRGYALTNWKGLPGIEWENEMKLIGHSCIFFVVGIMASEINSVIDCRLGRGAMFDFR